MQVCTCGGARPQNAAGERWPAGGLVAPSPGRNKVCLACAFWGRDKASLVVHASCGQTSDDRGTINFRYMGTRRPQPFHKSKGCETSFSVPSHPLSFLLSLFLSNPINYHQSYSLLLSKTHMSCSKRRTNSFLGCMHGSGTYDQRKWWGVEGDRIRGSTLSGTVTYFLPPLAADPFVPSPGSSGLRL